MAYADDADTDAKDTRGARYGGLSVASAALGVSGLVLVISTWAAWVFVVRIDRYPLPTISPVPSPPGAWSMAEVVDMVVAYVVGALWFAMLPVAALAILFGRLELRRAPSAASRQLARAGAAAGVTALLLSLAGAAVFSYQIGSIAPVGVAAR